MLSTWVIDRLDQQQPFLRLESSVDDSNDPSALVRLCAATSPIHDNPTEKASGSQPATMNAMRRGGNAAAAAHNDAQDLNAVPWTSPTADVAPSKYINGLQWGRFTGLPETLVQSPHSTCIISGASSNHFHEALCLLKQLDKRDIRLFFVDMGLPAAQRKTLEDYALKDRVYSSKLVVMDAPPMPKYAFEFEGGSTAFKPFILEHWMRYAERLGCTKAAWTDTSVRFKKLDLPPIRPEVGMAMDKKRFKNVEWTHPVMTEWWGYNRPDIQDASQYSGGYVLFDVASPRWRRVLGMWVACASDKLGCMKPPGSRVKAPRGQGFNWTMVDGIKYYWHRDDQSAISFALYKEYGVEGSATSVGTDMHWDVKRGQQCRPWPVIPTIVPQAVHDNGLSFRKRQS